MLQSSKQPPAMEADAVSCEPMAPLKARRSRGWCGLELVDVVLASVSLLVFAALLSYLLHATHLESHRVTNTLIAPDSPGMAKLLSRRARSVRVAEATTASSASADAASADASLATNLIVQEATVDLSAGRHLLAATADRSPFYPFDNEQHQKKLYAEWDAAFSASYTRTKSAMGAFTEMLGDAVAKKPVHAAPLGSTDYCVAGLNGQAQDPNYIMILKHTFHMLGMSSPASKLNPIRWGLVLFVTPENEKWFSEQLQIGKGLPGEHVRLIRASPIQKRQSDTIAASRLFWESVPCEHILYVAAEGLMVRSPEGGLAGSIHGGTQLADMMAKYMYLGAPWAWCNEDWCKLGGNGGISFRRRSLMLDLTREVACADFGCQWVDLYPRGQQSPDHTRHTEDTYFARMLSERPHKYGGRLASQAVMSEFCMETMDPTPAASVQPWFVLGAWNFLPPTRWTPLVSRVKQYYPETWQ